MTLKRLLQYLPMLGVLLVFGLLCAGLGAYSFGGEQIVVQVTNGACLPSALPGATVL